MTTQDVRDAIKLIEDESGDNESQHCMEDDLLFNVLKAIRDGETSSPRALAEAAIKVGELSYIKWYA